MLFLNFCYFVLKREHSPSNCTQLITRIFWNNFFFSNTKLYEKQLWVVPILIFLNFIFFLALKLIVTLELHISDRLNMECLWEWRYYLCWLEGFRIRYLQKKTETWKNEISWKTQKDCINNPGCTLILVDIF